MFIKQSMRIIICKVLHFQVNPINPNNLHTDSFNNLYIVLIILQGCPRGLWNCSMRVRTPVALLRSLSDKYPWEKYEPPYSPSYRLNSTTIVLLGDTPLNKETKPNLKFVRGCPRGVMVKAMDCGIVVSEFELQSCYYVHFRINTLGNGMNPLILPAMR